MLTFTVVTQDNVKPEVCTDARSPSQERNYHGVKANPALNLKGKCQCLKFSLDVFLFSCSTGRVQAHISWLQSQSNSMNLSLHHKHEAQATPCCQTSGVQEHWGGPALLAWVNACKPLQSRAGRLPATAACQATPGNCLGVTQLASARSMPGTSAA